METISWLLQYFMAYILPILVAILAFSFLVLIHELGHFWAAKRNGVKVLEFGIGFPPKIWSKKKGETIYSINAIPFGGFVRLYGEDVSDPKVLKDPRSFASKGKWARIQITIAGVVMNFLFAILALTIGFSIGIEPLIAEYGDVLKAVKSGIVEIEEGYIVGEVKDDSLVYKKGLREGDRIVAINDQSLDEFIINNAEKDKVSSLLYKRSGTEFSIVFDEGISFEELNLPLKTPFQLPRVFVFNNQKSLLAGDRIEQVNGVEVFNYQDLLEANKLKDLDTIFVNRNGEGINLNFNLDLNDKYLLSEDVFLNKANYSLVVESQTAELQSKKLFERGDLLVAINDKKINKLEDLKTESSKYKGKSVAITLVRDAKEITINSEVKEDGTLGLFLVPLLNEEKDLKFYSGLEDVSLVKINNIKYPIHQAFFYSLGEVFRLGKLTVVMFGSVFGDIFSSFSVPDGVAGPVGIAKMTVGFAKQGALSLLRFIAIISLSLAVLNLLPVPALDGGRLLFILIEAVRGKPLKAQTEAMIHGIGFMFLMLLIFLVTFKDIFG